MSRHLPLLALLAIHLTAQVSTQRSESVVRTGVEGVIGSAFECNREIDRLLWVRKTYGAWSEDMESAFAAGAAVGFKTRFLAIRIISDSEFYAPEIQGNAGEYCAAFVVDLIKSRIFIEISGR